MFKSASPGLAKVGKLLQTTKGIELPNARSTNKTLKLRPTFAPKGIKPNTGMGPDRIPRKLNRLPNSQ
jgi:hypothetical protein